MQIDKTRARIKSLILRRFPDKGLKAASRAIGRNDAYFQQFIERGVPRRLPEEVREKLADCLGVDQTLLREPNGAAPAMELAEEGAVYEGPGDEAQIQALLGAIYPGHDHAYFMKIRDHSMDNKGMLPGDFVVVDPGLAPHPHEIVAVQVYDNEQGSAMTVLRAYLPPMLSPVSRLTDFETYVIDDVDNYNQPRTRIVGVVTRLYRQTATAA